MANAAPEGRQRGEDGGMTIRKPRLGQEKNVAEKGEAPPSEPSERSAQMTP
jgi:hypothetical protein